MTRDVVERSIRDTTGTTLPPDEKPDCDDPDDPGGIMTLYSTQTGSSVFAMVFEQHETPTRELAWYSDLSFPLEDPGLDPESCLVITGARGGVQPTPPCLSEAIPSVTARDGDTKDLRYLKRSRKNERLWAAG